MSDDPKHNPSQIRRRAVTVAIAFFSLIALYLTGFVVALTVGPGLSPPVTDVLSVVYWPLIKADENNIEPFQRVKAIMGRCSKTKPWSIPSGSEFTM